MLTKNLSSFSNHWLIWGILATLAMGGALLNAWLGFPFLAPSEGIHSAIGGVIPYSDAEGYLSGAHRFNDLGFLDPWNMRRPLNTLLIAFYLKITNGNFWYVMSIQTSFCIIALMLYLKTISQDMGKLAAGVSLIFIYYYAQRYINTPLTEILGLTLGLLSFVLLWNGWLQRKRSIFNAGMASLAIALSARAGPNFMAFGLLFLVYLEPFTSSRLNDLSGSILSFAIPFFIMTKLSIFFGEPSGSGMAFSNFGSVLYGLVCGGKGWTYAFEDPFIQQLIAGKSEAQQAIILYQESWNAFKNNPLHLIIGMVKYSGVFFTWFITQLSIGAGVVEIITSIFSILVWAFIGIRIYKKQRTFNLEFLFLTLVFWGVLASAMIVFIDGGMRTFAVAIPFIGALIGLAFASTPILKERTLYENIGAICIALFLLLAPTLTSFMPLRPQVPDILKVKTGQIPGQEIFLTYNPNKQPHLLLDASPGFHFRTISPDTIKKSWVIYSYSDSAIAHDLINVVNGFKNKNLVLLHVYDYITHSSKWIIAENHILNLKCEWIEIHAAIFLQDFKRTYVANRFTELPQK